LAVIAWALGRDQAAAWRGEDARLGRAGAAHAQPAAGRDIVADSVAAVVTWFGAMQAQDYVSGL